MKNIDKASLTERWAHLRFSVIGPLLASPPGDGELQAALDELASRQWLHPGTGRPTRFAFSTIERWYYRALNERRDPVGVLRRAVRRDRGQVRALSEQLRTRLIAQYREHPSWSYQLHADNLAALVETEPSLGPMPSYVTVRRFMQRNGLVRRRRQRPVPGATTETVHEHREVRSYESEHVNALWHADFHHGSLRVLNSDGQWVRPIAFGALDDRSRVVCHVQWYVSETARTFVHGLSQAFQKRALPRSLMTDNGSPMLAAETAEGLRRLGVVHDTTLPHAPYQNGKQEVFWAQLEGRLLAMLESRRELTLAELNHATQVWCEDDHDRKRHSELGMTPLDCYLQGPDLGRNSPDSEALRLAFTTEVQRRQRRSDGTISLDGTRFEVPLRYRHIPLVTVRYARWDLTRVHLVDPASGKTLVSLYPQDKLGNADGRRRPLPPDPAAEPAPPSNQVAPLMKKLLAEQAAKETPTTYIPLDEPARSDEEER